MAFLLDFKKRLVKAHYLFVVLLTEILDHRNCLASFALLEPGCLWTHVPANAADFVGFVVSVASHHNCMLKLVVDCLLNLNSLGGLACEFLSFLVESEHLLVNELETVVNRQVLADVIND